MEVHIKKPPNPTGGVIQCCDCGKYGHIAFPYDLDPDMPQGWKVVWVNLKPHYICGACGRKRAQRVLNRATK